MALDLDSFLQAELAEHRAAFEANARELKVPFERVLGLCERAVRGKSKLLTFGNGGSASDAQHIAAELVIRYKTDRPAIAAISLATDTSAITAGANDHGFETIFARQIEALARPGDIALGISTSGNSANVLAGLKEARRLGVTTIGLTGGDGGKMHGLCDALIVVPSTVTARIQEMHILIGHMLCKALEIRLGYV